MRINQLQELRKVHLEIMDRSIQDSYEDIQNSEAMLLDAMKKVLELRKLVRMQGLLALEDAVSDITLDSSEEQLKHLIILVTDGTDPDVLLGIGMTRYYANLYTDYSALRYFIYLEGALSIQAGDNPRVLEEKLKVMLPHNLYLKISGEQAADLVREYTDSDN